MPETWRQADVKDPWGPGVTLSDSTRRDLCPGMAGVGKPGWAALGQERVG